MGFRVPSRDPNRQDLEGADELDLKDFGPKRVGFLGVLLGLFYPPFKIIGKGSWEMLGT